MNKNLSLFFVLSTCAINTQLCSAQSNEGLIFDDEQEIVENYDFNKIFNENLKTKGIFLNNEIVEKKELPKDSLFFERKNLSDLIENFNEDKFLSMPALKKGDKGENVDLLLNVLFQRGIINEWNHGMEFSQEIEDLIKKEQEKFGIKPDGIAGSLLYHSLLYSGEEIKNHLNNLESWKTSKILEAKLKGYNNVIFVNIPSYELSVYETLNGGKVFRTTTVVGATKSKTPTLLTYIVDLKHNPDWSPTPSARSQGKKYTHPGPNNPLGLMRFSTNNNLNIYLHDTNQKGLFKENFKAKSMGCVRVDDWKTLAAILRRSSVEDMLKVNETKRTFHEKVSKTPVYILYSRADKIGDYPMIFPDVYNKKTYLETPNKELD